MDKGAYLEHLRLDGERLSHVARTDPRAHVLTCDPWTMTDLVVHLGGVYNHKAAAIRLKGEEPPRAHNHDGDPFDRFDESLLEIMELLSEVDAKAPSWTWYPPVQEAGFWHRRLAHETLIHRVDAELSAGLHVSLIDEELALDGIEEILVRFLVFGSEGVKVGGEGERIAIISGDETWLLRLEERAISLSRGGVNSDLQIEGNPNLVLLFLWGRISENQLELSGDLAPLEKLKVSLKRSTQ